MKKSSSVYHQLYVIDRVECSITLTKSRFNFTIYMDIHPLWLVCILVRFSLIFIIRYVYENVKDNFLHVLFPILLLLMGLGFLHKGLVGSNAEIQINKVFWHETRYLHGALYVLSSYYLWNKNLNMNTLVLFLDLIFSFLYRFLLDK